MDQKERIIEQAMHMFVSQGIKSVRMDDIAQQLGVSKRTLYELFGDKEGLLYLAMDRYFEKKRIERAAVCAHARNVLEAMFMVLGGVMDNAEVIQRLLNNLRKFYPAVHDKMTREGTAKSRRDLQEMLEKGIADGLFVDTINLDLAISVLYYTASAITVRKDLILPAGMTEREAFVQIISNFFRGISTTKGAAARRRLPETLRACQNRSPDAIAGAKGRGLKYPSVPFVRINDNDNIILPNNDETTFFDHRLLGGGRRRRFGADAADASPGAGSRLERKPDRQGRGDGGAALRLREAPDVGQPAAADFGVGQLHPFDREVRDARRHFVRSR